MIIHYSLFEYDYDYDHAYGLSSGLCLIVYGSFSIWYPHFVHFCYLLIESEKVG
mgnify:CR=1 FL=1